MAESNILRSFEVHTLYDYVYTPTRIVRSLQNMSVNGDGTSQKLAYVLVLLMTKFFDNFFMKLYSLFCQPGARRTLRGPSRNSGCVTRNGLLNVVLLFFTVDCEYNLLCYV